MNHCLLLVSFVISVLLLPFGHVSAEESAKPANLIKYVLLSDGTVFSQDNPETIQKYSLHCVQKATNVVESGTLEISDKNPMRFRDTKESTGLTKCSSLVTGFGKHGAGVRYEVEVNPNTIPASVVATREIIVPKKTTKTADTNTNNSTATKN